MEMISSMKPNLWASLADEVPASVSAKRNRISVDRTLKWLDQCISLNPVTSPCLFELNSLDAPMHSFCY